MKVILSIKPEFANKIFTGDKHYEFRRSIFKQKKEVKTVIVYASAPISKVIGEFDLEYIIENKIDELWEITKNYSGISENFYRQYFTGKVQGFALKVKEPKLYEKPLDIQDAYGLKAPQSFAYVR